MGVHRDQVPEVNIEEVEDVYPLGSIRPNLDDIRELIEFATDVTGTDSKEVKIRFATGSVDTVDDLAGLSRADLKDVTVIVGDVQIKLCRRRAEIVGPKYLARRIGNNWKSRVEISPSTETLLLIATGVAILGLLMSTLIGTGKSDEKFFIISFSSFLIITLVALLCRALLFARGECAIILRTRKEISASNRLTRRDWITFTISIVALGASIVAIFVSALKD